MLVSSISIPSDDNKFPIPKALTIPEIENIVNDFATATRNAMKAGFDAINVSISMDDLLKTKQDLHYKFSILWLPRLILNKLLVTHLIRKLPLMSRKNPLEI
ncbi:uncharacterized protein BX664DRAFT_382497 [Halteromyces radiatus]|uniref:uncharacterized protein n=1 Tax=Halteromyces radiatus TaxID=101107 RepID=UPI00221EC497|nr:uncharacterized protein BX664DRAFT_382497 [Halteromyces radiatus]KAI8100056.1 hypothetical protein BX664DRAFT_382497 [Halteromyces radiatus]